MHGEVWDRTVHSVSFFISFRQWQVWLTVSLLTFLLFPQVADEIPYVFEIAKASFTFRNDFSSNHRNFLLGWLVHPK